MAETMGKILAALANATVKVRDHGGGTFRVTFDIALDGEAMAMISADAARDGHEVCAQVWTAIKKLRRRWLFKPKPE